MSTKEVACAPAMLTPSERKHIRERAAASKDGRIIELGTFLGASSECLCAGAADRINSDHPLIVYDAFKTTPDMHAVHPMPFNDGESFRALYDLFQRDRLGRMCIREGYLPEDAPLASAERIYPEQEPISLLFVDLAKTEGVHRTVIRVFLSHVLPGTDVIHQDFKHPHCTWLPLHMHALRRYFHPTHNVPGWTVTFRCVETPPSEAGCSKVLVTESLDAPVLQARWDDTIAWLSDEGHPELESYMELHRAMHLLRAKQWDAAVHACKAASCAAAPSHIDTASLKANALYLMTTFESYASLGSTVAEQGAAFLRDWTATLTCDETEIARLALWRQLAARLNSQGYRRVALLGAGQHARWLLSNGWPNHMLDSVVVLDDAPAKLPGVVVHHPDYFDEPIDAVIPCSTHIERELIDRARAIFEPRGVPVIPVYTIGSQVVPVEEGA